MKFAFKIFGLGLLFMSLAGLAGAQVPNPIMMESGQPLNAAGQKGEVYDDIVKDRMIMNKRVLPYDNIREADIMWEKRVWRLIDIREKMNLTFANEKRMFIEILLDAAQSGEIQVFKDEEFTLAFDTSEIKNIGVEVDTVTTFDPVTYEPIVKIVRNDFDPSTVKRYRVKEVWYFDEELSQLKVRILGIAPVYNVTVEGGQSVGERAMFWVYYPSARQTFARERVFNYANNAAPMSWDDLFEMRYFSSYIYKEANEFDRRLQDYLEGLDLLRESEKIKMDIFNMEHDLWSY